MSKETAHQLGTPASSLAAWVDILREKHPEITLSDEMSKDIEQLERVTERFSKIGSKPDLSNDDIIKVLYQCVEYLRKRTSSKILFNIEPDSSAELIFPVNPALFSWVIENVCRNAVDATGGEGVISIYAEGASARGQRSITIDITDNGKGIPRSLHKKIFRPGFTTKKTGWGLGLSLAKRIIEEYHNGRIFVKHSEPGKGTCVRIIMKTGPGGQAE
jgi:signal transduction histidine kinase